MNFALCAALLFPAAGAAEDAPPARQAVVVAGTGEAASHGDGGLATEAAVSNPFGVAVAPDGGILICEVDGHRVRRVDPVTGIITTVVGAGEAGNDGDGGPATQARLMEPYEITFDAQGRWLIVDMLAHVVRRVDPSTGLIETVAGSGEAGFSGDGGSATKAKLNRPHSVVVATDGTILICDIGNHRVRSIDSKSGVIRTLAGDGTKGKTPPDAPFAPTTALAGPRAMFIAPAADGGPGDWLLALREGNALFRIPAPEEDSSARLLRRIAGSGRSGHTGDGNPALRATLAGPKGVTVLPNGDVVLADTENHAIRVIDAADGTIRTILGRDAAGKVQGGFTLARPHGVGAMADGSILVGDSENHRVLRLPPPAE
ncbi:NHL domain-containing protein [Alienimonas californiensis]|uniref:Virginiamycin B lyase n=1 Tax=Alienimonas californiensis TaxID=2527989 RepID=A0A517PEV2_9PLAN|nr:hypothetical protein [Alienimonas californiensis]QDT17898.1 Virginiamycin B lyase [Alienimonas californiensis]